MVLFKKKTKPGEHEVVREGDQDVVHINYEGYSKIPSIEDDSSVMSDVIEKLAQSPSANRIIFHQRKKYEYSYSQTKMLVEVARIYSYFIKQKSILSQAALEMFGPLRDSSSRIKNLQYIVLDLLKHDPVGAFVETKRLLRDERINLVKDNSEDYKISVQPYLSVLTELYSMLNDSEIIKNSREFLDGYEVGSKEVYRKLFKPSITLDFMYTRLLASPPMDGKELDSYSSGSNDVQIFNVHETIKPLYHLTPPEFKINEDKYELLEIARKVLSEHQPRAEEFLDPDKMRDTFFNISKDLLTELSSARGMQLSYSEIEELAHILVRYTVGFGLIEPLLMDDKIQDIAINSPAGSSPVFVVHSDFDECVTNIIPSFEDVDSWASKLRLISARPLDEANPVLDTELSIPGVRARVAVIGRPLNPTGIAFSIRRHRDNPWTLPLFMKNNMITDLGAGLLSFLIDGNRTLLVAGTRGSGKCVIGETPIYLGNGETKNIKDIIEEKFSENKIKTDETWEYVDGDGTEVLSMDISNFKIQRSKILKFWRHKAPPVLIKVNTLQNREVTCTSEHPFFIQENGRVINKRADELLIGDKLAHPKDLILGSEVEFDEIISLDFLMNHNEEYVYDFSVAINKNFVAGKIPLIAHNTSLLGSVLVEIMRKFRIISLEDTLELPVDSLRKLGYNIQGMKVRSALTSGGSELSADEGIRTSLRMGDSALIVGEVRSTESLALYEAMRTGALANVVAGTIHGDSPYGVFDRVVNDLKVPRTSFKATDIIIVANPIRTADGLHRVRRITQITEVRKTWENDPLAENGFVDLMKYNSKTDTLEPTDALINGDSEIVKAIGGSVKDFAGSWDAIWENILLRAKTKKTILEYAKQSGNFDLLEAKAVIYMNDEFHRISDSVRQKVGFLDSKQIFFEWEEALKRYIKLNY